ncbi:MAG: ABC transporter substrate-binding protein [Lactobacillus sp.]|jgi:phospholipid transport system substrate-binding protein|nr:ABC transporter substrate-binding protein [Lactobacillus sp.]
MKRNLFLQLIIFCFCIFNTPVQAAGIAEKEAKLWVEDKGSRLLEAFAEEDMERKFNTLDELFINYVDLDYISRFVIGKYWREMTKEQQAQYKKLFTRYALGVYKSFPLSFKDRIGFDVSKVNIDGKYAEVTTKVSLNNVDMEPIDLTFFLDKKKDIKLVDIKLEKISLILSYRTRFYQKIREVDEDMTWFLEDFETTVKSTETSNRLKLEN